MKSTVVTLLVCILIVGILNLGASFGLFGGSDDGDSAVNFEYRVVLPVELNTIGYDSIYAEDGREPPEIKGQYTFQNNDQRIFPVHIVPRILKEIEKNGGWEFVAATQEYFIFRRPYDAENLLERPKKPEEPDPGESAPAPPAPAPAPAPQ